MSEIELAVDKLSHRAFVILGLISETSMQGGCHAYSIDQRIDERGMRNWTEIGKSSIYDIVKRLEDDDLVESYSKEVDGRIRKMYTMTHKGYKILQEKVHKTIREFNGRRNPDYDVALSMYTMIPKKEQIEAFKKSLEIINNDLEFLKKNEERTEKTSMDSIGVYPLSIEALFVRPYMIMQSHIEFIEWMIEKIPEDEASWVK